MTATRVVVVNPTPSPQLGVSLFLAHDIASEPPDAVLTLLEVRAGRATRAQAPLVRGMNCGKRSTVHEWHTMAVRFLPRSTRLDKNREPSFVRLNSNGKLRYSWAVDLGPRVGKRV